MRHFDSFAISIALVVLGIAAVVSVAIFRDSKAEDEFMQECQQHEPHYRCVALWRAGEKSQAYPVVIPVPGA